MKPNQKLKTNYFSDDWTWTKRYLLIGFSVLTSLLFVSTVGYLLIIVTVLITVNAIIYPVSDLAVDNTYLYHLKTSKIKKLNSYKRYKISNIQSIRCQGIHNKTWEIIGFFGRNGLAWANKLEMTFKDNSSWSMELQIDRKELDEIVNLIKKQIKTKPNNGEHEEPL